MNTLPAFHQPLTRANDPTFYGYAVGAILDGDGRPAHVLISIVEPGLTLYNAGDQKPVPLSELEPAKRKAR